MPFNMQILDTIVCGRFRNIPQVVPAATLSLVAANDDGAPSHPGDDNLPPSGLLTLY